eukprot:759745-Hanusia_phi.AAC.5
MISTRVSDTVCDELESNSDEQVLIPACMWYTGPTQQRIQHSASARAEEKLNVKIKHSSVLSPRQRSP